VDDRLRYRLTAIAAQGPVFTPIYHKYIKVIIDGQSTMEAMGGYSAFIHEFLFVKKACCLLNQLFK
ncbi:MAG: hypothetical protein OQK44_04985, partial [Gammaproteobacteria bacterium]|nr:hypothetical protein [Gammaproteobacteria bacterium]